MRPAAIRLSALASPSGEAKWPDYLPEGHDVGIVHLGLGNFARAHLLAYTDKALAQQGGDWRVTGVSLRSTAVADQLTPQNGRYTLITRGRETTGIVIGSLHGVLAGAHVSEQALTAMSEAKCRIVSLTVTEKAYGISSTGRLDQTHPAVVYDLLQPEAPKGVIGLITAALARRYTAGLKSFTVLSCDNLSHNGAKLRSAVLDFARLAYNARLVAWIETETCFPSTMVDRITPASTVETAEIAFSLTGYDDHSAVETEPFSQWVIEDNFSDGRPHWEIAGAVFVADVGPYEQMKLRMLNGTHSMLAYCACLSSKTYVRDVMSDPYHAAMVKHYLAAAAATLLGLDLDLSAYAAALEQRFANPAIAHSTAQIAMDGSQKLSQRITAPALVALRANTDIRPFAFALAAWIAFLKQGQASGRFSLSDDPKAASLITAVAGKDQASELITALSEICPDILPPDLTSGVFGEAICGLLEAILTEGINAVMLQELTRYRK